MMMLHSQEHGHVSGLLVFLKKQYKKRQVRLCVYNLCLCVMLLNIVI